MRVLLAALCTSAIVLSACGQDVTGTVPLSGEAPEASGYETQTVIDGLNHPWSIVWLPEGDEAGEMLITERRGTLRVVRDGALDPDPVFDAFPDLAAVGQGGLMEISLHPEFAANRVVYFTYSTGERRNNRTVLARAELRNGTLEGLEEIFRVGISKPGGQHFGSRIVWLPDGTMLLAIGDGGNPPVQYEGEWMRNQAQNPANHIGKVVHLKDDGSPAADTPAFEGGLPEVYSIGHRNIQGMVIDPETGNVWANEHGARGGDELNLIVRGTNYGWPEVTYSREYRGPRVSDKTAAPGVQDPVVIWTPSKAPSGLAFYTGAAFPQWQGDLFSGALVLRHIRRIDLEDGKAVGEEMIRTEARVRDVRQGPDGFIYYLTDETRGELRRLVPASD